jgi:hypothetical protein
VRFVLVPSALLGPATWLPVAEALTGLGHEAEVRAPDEVAEAAGAVLVPHSNAGLGSADLAVRLGARAVVYVDAALPLHVQDGSCARAPAQLRDVLAGLADHDRLLPPWTQWWDDLTGLFPDDETRARVEAEQPRLPLRWFDERVPVPVGWDAVPSAYLAFGDTYADEQAFARAHGWPVTVVDGGHLHQLHAPEAVAGTVVELAGALAARPDAQVGS